MSMGSCTPSGPRGKGKQHFLGDTKLQVTASFMEQEGTIVSTSLAPVDNNRAGEGRLCRRFFGCHWRPIVRRGVCLVWLGFILFWY
ncbi:hypothetical protein BDV26DRAFT_109362 [Aspergillus bertholletiae]|uniref:Uncharacterized protein n=1 Tax=Aspergillus bertholletiae TaxID=1226010 RepID=A0A5N7AT47_9EURO|nr:hypothetical protein BDV26DRAFT_109362 [Aspergillus bertholletiae]